MINVVLNGRLGNQLFQFAFAYHISKQKKTNYCLNQKVERCSLIEFFDISTGPFHLIDTYLFSIKGFKNIFNHHFRRSFYKFIDGFFKTNSQFIPFDEPYLNAIKTINNHRSFEGYFQSELYFEPHKREIKNLLKIKKKYLNDFKDNFSKIYKPGYKTVVVHIRRTDYQHLEILDLGNADLRLPATYYHQLINKLEKSANNYQFIFIGDDISFIENEFGYVQNKYISTENEIIDFQLLMNADICITSNSTFSWWGAYLNAKPDKIIYCPKYFLGFHIKQTIPPDIYPSNWQIEYINSENK